MFLEVTQKKKSANKTTKPCKPTVWQLDLKTKQWKILGTHGDTIYENSPKNKLFQADGKIYFTKKEGIHEIDIVNDLVKRYTLKEWKDILQIVYHPKKKWVSYTYRDLNGKNIAISEPLKNLLGELKSENPFYKKTASLKFIGLGTGGILFVIVLLFSVQKLWRRHVVLNGLVYHTKTRTFSYHKKELTSFKGPLKELLIHLMQHNKQFLGLTSLDVIFEDDEIISGAGTVIKRRETAVNDLRYKLSTLLEISSSTVFETRKNPKDRRAKEIRLAVAILQTNP